MKPGNPVVELLANVDHEIRALEDGTVVVNLSIGSPQTVTNAAPGELAQAGGVTMVEHGTVATIGRCFGC